MGTVKKAIAAAIAGLGAAFATAVADGDFTTKERWICAGATVGAFALVYAAPKNEG